MDDITAAAALFSDPSPDTQSAAPEQSPDQKAAATLYAPEPEAKPVTDLPVDIAKLRAEDPDRAMFDAQSMQGSVPFEAAFADVEGFTDDVKASAAREWREISVDVGLSVPEATTVIAEFQHALTNPPTAETRATWAAESQRQLVEKYGADAPRVLADAKRLATRDPRVASLLDRSGLGDSPGMVMRMAELARQQRARGKLK